MDLLEKEHERLLREIAKKRAKFQETIELARDLMTTFAANAFPLKEQLDALAREMRELFESLIGSESRLGRRDKLKVRNVYYQMLASMPPDLQQAMFSNDDEDFENDHEGFEGFDEVPPSHRQSSRPARFADDSPEESGYSATKPQGEHTSTLRALFRRLAIALHPDKTRDPEEKLERTQVMQDVTRAYEAGDLARLLELERSFLASMPAPDDPDALQRQELQLRKANDELRRQLRQLTAEQKAVRDSLPVTLDLRSRDKAHQKARRDLDGVLAEAQREVDQFRALRDFVHAFANGKIGLREFLAGPPSQHEDDGDLLESLLDSLLDEKFETQRRAGGGRRSSRRRG